MAKWLDLFPLDWLDKDAKDEVLTWIAGLPIDRVTKREMFMEWCKEVGYKPTKDDFNLLV